MQKKQVIMQEDGSSFHTFSARYSLSKKGFDALFEHLKKVSEHEEFYKPKGFNADCWVCNHFSDEGLLLYLSKVPDDKGYVHYVVTCRINPRKLIDPNCSYYGIMSMDRKSLDRMEARFQKILHKVGMDQELNDGTLSRLDLCANLMFPLKKLPKTIMACLAKSAINGNYRLVDPRKKKIQEPLSYPKNSLYVVPRNQKDDDYKSCFELVLYDKQAQMKENGLLGAVEKHSKENQYGILRIELHLGSRKIRELAGSEKSTREQIEYLAGRSGGLLLEYMGKVFPTGDFYSLDESKNLIDSGDFTNKMRKRMRRIVEAIAEGDTFLEALGDCEENLSGKKITKTTKNFDRLGMNAVPLPKKAKLDYLPSVYHMMQALDGEEERAVRFVDLKKR